MARIGRGFPSRLTVDSKSRPTHSTTGLGVFTVGWEFPAITVDTPSVTVDLSVFTVGWEFPALTVSYDTAVSMGVFTVGWEFPALAVDVPVLPGSRLTGDFQIEWAGLVFGGHGNVYQIAVVEGWDDLPEIDSGNAPRSARHGSWPGRDYAQERTVSATVAIDGPQDSTAWVVANRNLRRVMGISEDGSESNLVIRTLGESLLATGKPRGRVMPAESYGQRWTAVSLRWVCSDPRRYDLQQQSVTTAAGGTAVCVNDGDVATSPRIKIFGPVVNPVLTNESLGRILRFTLTLTEGQQLLVDTNAGEVTLAGTDAMGDLSEASVPVEEWVLAAGSNTIAYTASSGGATGIELLFRSAFL